MKDSTIITHADVYDDVPSTSDGVLMSGDSPPPLQASLPSSGFETPNDVHNGKITPISSIQKSTGVDVDVEDIEEAVPIIHKTLPVPEPKPSIEKNGADYYDVADGKQLVHDVDDDPCVIKCLYFTQQCCECTIL
ncbi:uncharacterized protein LOC107269220 isoform X2 [Cephus cinctus]|uniref:Uncharacterized protein LOC107269220 isoform X2 n=1 Tax=Cephus cinctus TaxID=211228 RepID=A0AAJ7BZJ6_CEPCN|nr:uncharacterized protein LOC107269220 isoform X2 [Cephus cinctus]